MRSLRPFLANFVQVLYFSDWEAIHDHIIGQIGYFATNCDNIFSNEVPTTLRKQSSS